MKLNIKILIPIALTLVVFTGYGTIQIPEKLIFGSDTIMIEEYPLDVKIKEDSTLLTRGYKKNQEETALVCVTSACWRGYQGTWKIINDSLYLINLLPSCDLKENEVNPLNIKKLFDDFIPSRGVFASWVNDTLNKKCTMLPCDKIDKHFIISNGILIKKYQTINKDWIERNTDNKEIKEEDLDVFSLQAENSIDSKWYFILGGILLIIFVVSIAKLKKAKKL